MIGFFFQREVKQQLRHNLSRLPKPKNDYEIVLPDTADQNNDNDQMDLSNLNDEDQADIDQRKRDERRRKRKRNTIKYLFSLLFFFVLLSYRRRTF